MRIVVYHGYYGCETGCCGHVIDAYPAPGEVIPQQVGRGQTFNHNWNNLPDREYINELLLREGWSEEHLADVDYENCIIINDY